MPWGSSASLMARIISMCDVASDCENAYMTLHAAGRFSEDVLDLLERRDVGQDTQDRRPSDLSARSRSKAD